MICWELEQLDISAGADGVLYFLYDKTAYAFECDWRSSTPIKMQHEVQTKWNLEPKSTAMRSHVCV